MAREILKLAQGKMKELFERKAEERYFGSGDEVLLHLPMQGQPLAAKFSKPYYIEEKVETLTTW